MAVCGSGDKPNMKQLIVGCHPYASRSVCLEPNKLVRMPLTLDATCQAHHGASLSVMDYEPGMRGSWSCDFCSQDQ